VGHPDFGGKKRHAKAATWRANYRGSPLPTSNISTIMCLELDGDSNDTEDYIGSGLNSPTSSVFRCIRAQVCSRGYKLVRSGNLVPSP
jgi:hypothetical protein